MLRHLRLEEFVIVERGELGFSPGLNVLSGETGAGKSILIDAVGFLAGGRASSDWVRRGAARLMVEGELALDPGSSGREACRRLGVPLPEDGLLLLRRELASDGRSRCFANGCQILVSQLREVAEGALWIVGQGEQRALTTWREQEDVLDRYAKALPLRADYRDLRARFQEAREDQAAVARDEEAFSREEDWLRFQAREIEDAGIVPGEWERLQGERAEARNRVLEEGLVAELRERLLDGEGSILDHLETLGHRLGQVPGDRWAELRDAILDLRERARALRRLVPSSENGLELDPEAIEERLRLLERLARKYLGAHPGDADRTDVERGILEHLRSVQSRLEDGEALEGKRQAAEARAADLRRRLAETGAALSKRRREASERLARTASGELGGLGMKDASLAFRFRREEDPDGVPDLTAPEAPGIRAFENGLERMSLLFRSHPAEPEGELARIASGGELSRVLLSIHAALGEAAPPGCWILDEVDAGIGGETAGRIGRRLQRMADHAQVLLVTHSAAIAARAERHLRVVKEEKDGRPSVRVEVLAGEERLGEIARMLSGDPGSAIARRHARELLSQAVSGHLSA